MNPVSPLFTWAVILPLIFGFVALGFAAMALPRSPWDRPAQGMFVAAALVADAKAFQWALTSPHMASIRVVGAALAVLIIQALAFAAVMRVQRDKGLPLPHQASFPSPSQTAALPAASQLHHEIESLAQKLRDKDLEIDAGNARVVRLAEERDEASRNHAAVTNHLKQANESHARERATLKQQIATGLTEIAATKHQLAEVTRVAVELEEKLNRCMTPQINFAIRPDPVNFGAPDPRTTDFSTDFYLEVTSQIPIDDLRVCLEELPMSRGRHENFPILPLQVLDDQEPYRHVFSVKPGEVLTFNLGSWNESKSRSVFYFAVAPFERPSPSLFKITAAGSGTMAQSESWRIEFPRQLAATYKYAGPLKIKRVHESVM